jgi:hypothetical protein
MPKALLTSALLRSKVKSVRLPAPKQTEQITSAHAWGANCVQHSEPQYTVAELCNQGMAAVACVMDNTVHWQGACTSSMRRGRTRTARRADFRIAGSRLVNCCKCRAQVRSRSRADCTGALVPGEHGLLASVATLVPVASSPDWLGTFVGIECLCASAARLLWPRSWSWLVVEALSTLATLALLAPGSALCSCFHATSADEGITMIARMRSSRLPAAEASRSEHR